MNETSRKTWWAEFWSFWWFMTVLGGFSPILPFFKKFEKNLDFWRKIAVPDRIFMIRAFFIVICFLIITRNSKNLKKHEILAKKANFGEKMAIFRFFDVFFENFTFLIDLGGVSDLTSEKKNYFFFEKKSSWLAVVSNLGKIQPFN